MRKAAILFLLLATACVPEKDESKAPDAPETATAIAVTPTEAATAAPQPRKTEERTNAFEFDYSYPAEAAAIPALAAELDADLAKQRRELVAAAREGQVAAKENGFPFNPYSYSAGWSVVADLPGWLSLSAGASTYTGGAHPNHWSQALLWDKAAGQSRRATDLFTSRGALAAALRDPFCKALNRERAARRGEPIDPASEDMFDQCIDPTASTVILGSSNKQQFDRIGILIAPYEAGPYAEGDYEVTLPVTKAVLAAVKPQYRSVFALGR
ncbi:DUF3298 and DUF4163 domain-containing protein [Novosphingobium ginsenosidimutans]|uniref:DUF3298 and DUF4163 domain-containing protein n=1 Tax=Novosphingobium ginsenosidimutans TaxID=1176536 RepID=A0A5B8RZS4_9SPHN|nr:DUF3298 and DUF4163 domain-containing protein [Novosphingobium ginsenosidimutans]QEA14906.1 DUF3298 and DUF4163 domain-containing protein [Novosphingobium ginsenosidimutans]